MRVPALTLLLVLIATNVARADWMADDETKNPYTCTFHWWKADGHTFGLDVIRSDDTGKLGLRVFVRSPDGTMRKLVVEAPKAEWQPFSTTADVSGATENSIGRCPNEVSGSVRAPGQEIEAVRFRLAVKPTTKPKKLGTLGGSLVDLSALDYPEVPSSGFIEVRFKGEALARRFDFVDAAGPQSIHFGKRLPDYAYIATVPDGAGDRLLLSAIDGVAYAYTTLGGKSRTLVALGKPKDGKIRFADGTTLEVVKPLRSDHDLLGVPTSTGTARVKITRLEWKGGFWGGFDHVTRELDVFFDVRGTAFLQGLVPAPSLSPSKTKGLMGGLGS